MVRGSNFPVKCSLIQALDIRPLFSPTLQNPKILINSSFCRVFLALQHIKKLEIRFLIYRFYFISKLKRAQNREIEKISKTGNWILDFERCVVEQKKVCQKANRVCRTLKKVCSPTNLSHCLWANLFCSRANSAH